MTDLLLKPASKPDVPAFQHASASYTASARNLESWMSVRDFIAAMYGFVQPGQVESLYGFAHTFSPLYGGRTYKPQFSFRRHHLAEMAELGIGVSLNMTNHFFTDEAYEASLPLFDALNVKGNSITCFHDELAQRIRQDFPNFELKASIIRGLKTRARLEKLLETYDKAVLPMDRNDDVAFLEDLPEKERIILFANASCAYNCPSRSCYVGFSQANMGMEVNSFCSIPTHERVELGKVFFDMEALVGMGFRHFKLVPSMPPQAWEMKRRVLAHDRAHVHVVHRQKHNEATTIRSYPKSGRTWLRYALAQYFTAAKGLDFEPDLASMFTLFPNDKGDAARGVEALNSRLVKDLPLVIFSHAKKPDGAGREVVLLRSIPDTLVSEFHHYAHHMGVTEDALDDFLFAQPDKGVAGLVAYLNAWAEVATDPDTLVLTYEDMQADAAGSLSRVLEHLGEAAVDADALAHAVAGSSFAAMQAAEEAKPLPGVTYDLSNPDSRRMRRGQVGGWRETLSEAQMDQIRARFADGLSPQAQALVDRLGLMPAKTQD